MPENDVQTMGLPQTTKKASEIPTIDVSLVVAKFEGSPNAIAIDTATKVGVETLIETKEGVKLIVKGVLKAQKPEENTLTGHKLTLTNNVFTPELVLGFQGGEITYEEDQKTVKKYIPPVAGTKPNLKNATLELYSAVYNTSGGIEKYEKTTYPNCKATPVAFNSEDGVFRVQEFVITSAPNKGQAPYEIEYVTELPVITE